MDNALQSYLQQKNQLQDPDTANAAILAQNQQPTDDSAQIIASQQQLTNALSNYQNGGANGNPNAAYDPNLQALGKQANLFGVQNAPITEVFGQKQPNVEVFSHGITNGTGFAMPVGTPLSLPKGQWNVLASYAGANHPGFIGDATNSGYGNSVLVQNAQTGELLRFSHLSKVGVKAGQSVNGGIFALSGNTGNVTGPHLNLEYYTPNGQLGDVLKSSYTKYMGGSVPNAHGGGGGNPFMNFLGQVGGYLQNVFGNDKNLLAAANGDSSQSLANYQNQQQLQNQQQKQEQTYQQSQVSPDYNTNPPQPTANPTQAPNVLQQVQQAFMPQQQPQVAQAQEISPTPGNTDTQTGVTQIPGIAPQVSQNFTTILNNHILPVTRSYGIPDQVVAAQMAQESGYGQKPAGTNNYFGLKAHSYPGFANFQTPEDAATYYAQTIKSLVPNLDQIKNNPMKVLTALQSGKSHYEGDNADPMQYVRDVSGNPAWKAYNR